MKPARLLIAFAWLVSANALANAATVNADTFTYHDIFALEFASSPAPHPTENYAVFVRNYMDIMADRRYGNLWRVDYNGELRPLTGGDHQDHSPSWSPDGKRLAFVSNRSGSQQIHIYWTDTREHGQITRLTSSPSNLSWSPDGSMIAFTMFTPAPQKAPVTLPAAPRGAKWADAPKYIDKAQYRADGVGYLPDGYTQIYVMPAAGGTPRQLTDGDNRISGGVSWSADGKQLYFSANRHADAFENPINSEVYRLTISDRSIEQITDRFGPDHSPQVSPDGKRLAWLGFDDARKSYQLTELYVLELDVANAQPQQLSADLDYAAGNIQWSNDSKGIYFSYAKHGKDVVALQPLNGQRMVITERMGGMSYSRPYSGGDYAVNDNGAVLFTMSHPQRPADLAISRGGNERVLTDLNSDLLAHKKLAHIEEIWYTSSHDDKQIQGWIAYPPDFDASKKYPLILEIHGGPHTAYAGSFAAEIQLMAAAGYVVLYTNPRGSTSYGEAFAQEIHHNYPSHDHTDLMDGVDALIAKGFIDPARLFITGGSGGGVLTAWAIGHTDRFAAAVVAKPVINWYSFVLTADVYSYFARYWFPGMPWDNLEHYMKFSPISYVGKVTTPTMLLTGEADYRTPISESEQYYQALKLQGVESAMVRVPDAPHGIYSRPSNLIGKVAYILHWFDRYNTNSE
jgi:dipeptidyl aminopeptidase/acylaminoacyl peptidase